ncbi:hypothetical protein [Microbulbifer sp. ZKSA002]|uniref:hypothetical protein n=1 Tax=Microbulbifer sp. ZKSA002 TaxID=3243388 RepID=UPI00403A1675
MKFFLVVLILLISTSSYAGVESEYDNKLYIKWIESRWNEDGYVIAFDKNITYKASDPGCEWGASVVLSEENHMMSGMLSIALSAQMANKPITIYVKDQCFGSRAELISIRVYSEE